MVPARLQLRNFLCYRDAPPPLDLAHVRLACLAGDNGNGKSALLDAITWALWGRARGRDGDLISLGRTEMEVEFEFFVGEARYRVVRKCRRSAKGSTQSLLQFHVWDGGEWRAISGATQAETQRAIIDVLKLSYDTFVNSAFLMQGRADAFTVKGPAERKQVLAEILNLGQYDVYEARAKERRDDRWRTVAQLEVQIHDAEVELRGLSGRLAERAAVTEELAAREEELHRQRERLADLRAAVDTARALRRDLEAAEAARAAAAEELALAGERIAARRDEIARCEAITAEGPAIRDGHDRLRAARERLRVALATAEGLGGALADVEQTRHRAARELAAAEERAADRRAAIARYEAVTADAAAIREMFARLGWARATLAEQDRRLAAVRALEEEMKPLAEAVQRAEHSLRTDLRLQEAEMERLGATAAGLEALRRERAAAAREQEDLDALEGRLATLRAEESEHRAVVQALSSENTRLRTEMEELRRKVDELKEALAHGAADCPLCRSSLGVEGLRRVEESYEAEGRAKAARHRENRNRIHEREAAAQACAEEARRLDADLARRRGEWRSRLDRLERDIAAAEEADAKLVGVRDAVGRLRAALEAGDFAHAERARLAELGRRLDAAGYEAAAHEAARREIEACAGVEERHRALGEAESALAAAREALAAEERAAAGWRDQHAEAARRVGELRAQRDALPIEEARAESDRLAPYEERYRELVDVEARLPAARDALATEEAASAGARARHEEATARVEELRARVAGLAGLEGQLGPAQGRVQALAARCGELRQALGGVEQEIERLEELERTTAARRRRLTAAQRELGVYDELVTAFGKRGVQALIIEAALPEIESAANELLARMTNNRMHVALETQREALKGNVVETLDIKIADEWGTRSYEMYSGGEAFRINLALRIALSKLLARRAGAPLPTLVIDEGFGTQDAAGRERLLEAITAIQDDFQCLLVVTHIDELKDLFDTRIEVARNGDGSVARVVAV